MYRSLPLKARAGRSGLSCTKSRASNTSGAARLRLKRVTLNNLRSSLPIRRTHNTPLRSIEDLDEQRMATIRKGKREAEERHEHSEHEKYLAPAHIGIFDDAKRIESMQAYGLAAHGAACSAVQNMHNDRAVCTGTSETSQVARLLITAA